MENAQKDKNEFFWEKYLNENSNSLERVYTKFFSERIRIYKVYKKEDNLFSFEEFEKIFKEKWGAHISLEIKEGYDVDIPLKSIPAKQKLEKGFIYPIQYTLPI